MSNNPISFVDPDGGYDTDANPADGLSYDNMGNREVGLSRMGQLLNDLGYLDTSARSRQIHDENGWFENSLTPPTGYTVDEKGNIVEVDDTGGDRYDVIWEKGEYESGNKKYDYEGTENTGIRINDKGFIPELLEVNEEAKQLLAGSDEDYVQGYYATIEGKTQALNVFTFLADATSSSEKNSIGTEWSLLGTTSGEWAIGTLKEDSQGFMFSRISKYSDLSTHKDRLHSHPSATYDSFRVSGSDQYNANRTRKHNPKANFSIYMPEKTMRNYNRVMRDKVYSDGSPWRLLTREPLKFFEY